PTFLCRTGGSRFDSSRLLCQRLLLEPTPLQRQPLEVLYGVSEVVMERLEPLADTGGFVHQRLRERHPVLFQPFVVAVDREEEIDGRLVRVVVCDLDRPRLLAEPVYLRTSGLKDGRYYRVVLRDEGGHRT